MATRPARVQPPAITDDVGEGGGVLHHGLVVAGVDLRVGGEHDADAFAILRAVAGDHVVRLIGA